MVGSKCSLYVLKLFGIELPNLVRHTTILGIFKDWPYSAQGAGLRWFKGLCCKAWACCLLFTLICCQYSSSALYVVIVMVWSSALPVTTTAWSYCHSARFTAASVIISCMYTCVFHMVLWHCWLGDGKGIWTKKIPAAAVPRCSSLGVLWRRGLAWSDRWKK